MNESSTKGGEDQVVALLQAVGLLAVYQFYLTLHDEDKLLALVGRQLEVRSLLGVDVNDKGFHVPASLLLCQRVILHVLTGISSIVGETDAAVALTVFGTGDDRSQGVVVVHKCSQTHSQCTGYLNQRRQVLVILDRTNLVYTQTTAICNFLDREVLGLTESLDFHSNNRVITRHLNTH